MGLRARHPNRATATAVVAFGLSYVAAGVVLQCFTWDPEARRVVPVGIPNAESVAILTVVPLLSSAAFGGGLWVARRRGRVCRRAVHSVPPATPLEQLAAVLLIFGVPAALGFGLASKPRRLVAS